MTAILSRSHCVKKTMTWLKDISRMLWLQPQMSGTCVWGITLHVHIDGLMQERRNSIANALDSHHSCTNHRYDVWVVWEEINISACDLHNTMAVYILTKIHSLSSPVLILLYENTTNIPRVAWTICEVTDYATLFLQQLSVKLWTATINDL